MIHMLTKRGDVVPVKRARLERTKSLYGGEDRLELKIGGRVVLLGTPSQFREMLARINNSLLLK